MLENYAKKAYIINMINIKRIHNIEDYYSYAKAILDEEGNFYSEFSDWLAENELELKKEFSFRLLRNEDDTLDHTFLEWALEKWTIDNYNKLTEEINQLTGVADV